MSILNLKQDKQCKYNVTSRRIRITIVVVEKLLLLYSYTANEHEANGGTTL
jgi:hypothetical protein